MPTPLRALARVALVALVLVLVAPAPPALASAGRVEHVRVLQVYGSGAAIVRNALGQVYGVVYAGMDGSHDAEDAFAGFHGFATRAHEQRARGQMARLEPLRIMGQTPEGMLVVVGHLFLPGADAPLAADLLGSGLGWYRPDPANAYDGLFHDLEAVARAERHGVWGWARPVPNLGPTPPPPTPPVFDPQPLPDPIITAWDTLVASPEGGRFDDAAIRTQVRFQMALLDESWAGYSVRANMILLDQALLREDPRAIATVLAHEVTHAVQPHGPWEDCVTSEAEAFAVQSQVWALLGGRRPPARTELERQLNLVRFVYEQYGLAGLAELVQRQPGYQRECGLAA